MGSGPSKKGGKGTAYNSRVREFSSPQIVLPSYLSAWPDIKSPKAPNSVPKPRPGRKMFASAKEATAFDNPYEKNEKKDSSLTRRINKSDDLNKIVEAEPASRISTNINNEEPDARTNSSPLTLEDGSNERKERLKDATASQKQDKSTGKKKNREKGETENVFNARSPVQEKSSWMRDDNTTPTQTRSRANSGYSPSFSLPNSSAKAVSTVRKDHSNATSQKAPANLLVKPSSISSPKAVPVRSTSIIPTRNEQMTFQSNEAHQISHKDSAAMTEAQLQANLLRKSGHREFSSQAFEVCDRNELEAEARFKRELAKGAKKHKKREKVEDADPDPVKAEIAKQQANYNDYMNMRMKENPDRYPNNGVNVVHEVTSEEEWDYENTYEQTKGSEHKINIPRSDIHDDAHQTWSATKKDKDRLKKKRNREDGPSEEDTRIEGSRKKSKATNDGKYERSGNEAQNHLVENGRSNDNSIIRPTAKATNTTSPSQSTATYFEHPKPVSLQQLRNTPPMTVITENANANAEFIATLKSFWGIIPKALLHTTMTNLNKENRRLLNAKLKSCQQGKQTNPHIRIITRINENGDQIELLEEYGKISEPDPYTMSSEMTLLTAARELIILLSGERVGFGLSSVVPPPLEGETKSVNASNRRPAVQGRVGEVSLMEEELGRIANEYQKEIDKLREENQKLAAKVKKSKR